MIVGLRRFVERKEGKEREEGEEVSPTGKSLSNNRWVRR
jgi:hypothetical protein